MNKTSVIFTLEIHLLSPCHPYPPPPQPPVPRDSCLCPREDGQTQREVSLMLASEAFHCSLYPGQEVGDLHEDPWRGPIRFSIGESPLDHVVTHEGAPGVPLWAERGRTEQASRWSCPPLCCPGDGWSMSGDCMGDWAQGRPCPLSQSLGSSLAPAVLPSVTQAKPFSPILRETQGWGGGG